MLRTYFRSISTVNSHIYFGVYLPHDEIYTHSFTIIALGQHLPTISTRIHINGICFHYQQHTFNFIAPLLHTFQVHVSAVFQIEHRILIGNSPPPSKVKCSLDLFIFRGIYFPWKAKDVHPLHFRQLVVPVRSAYNIRTLSKFWNSP